MFGYYNNCNKFVLRFNVCTKNHRIRKHFYCTGKKRKDNDLQVEENELYHQLRTCNAHDIQK